VIVLKQSCKSHDMGWWIRASEGVEVLVAGSCQQCLDRPLAAVVTEWMEGDPDLGWDTFCGASGGRRRREDSAGEESGCWGSWLGCGLRLEAAP